MIDQYVIEITLKRQNTCIKTQVAFVTYISLWIELIMSLQSKRIRIEKEDEVEGESQTLTTEEENDESAPKNSIKQPRAKKLRRSSTEENEEKAEAFKASKNKEKERKVLLLSQCSLG